MEQYRACVALGQPITPAAKRSFGWVAVDEVAITHDQGLGDNRKQPWTFIIIVKM